MTTSQLDKKIGAIVEQKLLEFLGDPDEGLSVRKEFLERLQKGRRGIRKFMSHAAVLKKHGLR